MSNVREIAQYWAETNCFDETTREEAKLLLETATEEEIAADNLRVLRDMRDQKLAETDWSQGADVPDALKTKYTTYRQALRDITKTYNNWTDVVWPDKPS